MHYDKINLPAQDYDVEWETKAGEEHTSIFSAKTAVIAERKALKSLQRRADFARILCVEPTE